MSFDPAIDLPRPDEFVFGPVQEPPGDPGPSTAVEVPCLLDGADGFASGKGQSPVDEDPIDTIWKDDSLGSLRTPDPQPEETAYDLEQINFNFEQIKFPLNHGDGMSFDLFG